HAMRQAIGGAAGVGGEDASRRLFFEYLHALRGKRSAEGAPAPAHPAPGVGLPARNADERVGRDVVRADRHARASKKRRPAGRLFMSAAALQLPPPVVAGSAAAGVSAGPAGISASTGSAACALRTRWYARPVPAGMRRPTITFSFRPRSTSRLPMIAASVSTRVVSWNEAAEMNESVESEALVIPSSMCSYTAGCLPSPVALSFS